MMKFLKNNIYLFAIIFLYNAINAQEIIKNDSLGDLKKENIKFNYKQLIIPTVLIAYGVIGIKNDGLLGINRDFRNEEIENNHKKITIDNFSQYAPAVSVYALNLVGIKGKNNLRDRSVILATSYLIMGTTTYALKKITKIERPDCSGYNSFPSGHTGTAFAGAEFLWQEYKDVSIWYGISGYVVATGTGFLRTYNDKHWLTDVAMGAGVGILSTKIAYWVFPFINNKIFKSNKNVNSAVVAPFYNGNQMGVGMVLNLK